MMNPTNLMARVVEVLAAAGIDAQEKRAARSSDGEAVVVQTIPAIEVNRYFSGRVRWEQRYMVSVRRWSELDARAVAYECLDALAAADLSGEGYEFEESRVYEQPQEVGFDSANFCVWSLIMSAVVTAMDND